jgi:hypothetical protein
MKKSKLRSHLLILNAENDTNGKVKRGFSDTFIGADSLFGQANTLGTNKKKVCHPINNCDAGNCTPGCGIKS